MTCFMCKGNLENKTTTFMNEVDNCIIIIKNVPSQVCSQCGEVSYSHEVTKRLEGIMQALKQSLTEIAVVYYSDNVA